MLEPFEEADYSSDKHEIIIQGDLVFNNIK